MDVLKRILIGAFWGVIGCFIFKILLMKMTNKHLDAYDTQLLFWIVAGLVSSVLAKSFGSLIINPVLIKDLKEMFTWRASREVFFTQAGLLLAISIVVGLCIAISNLSSKSVKYMKRDDNGNAENNINQSEIPQELRQSRTVVETDENTANFQNRFSQRKRDQKKQLRERRDEIFKETGYKFTELYSGMTDDPASMQRVTYLNKKYPGFLDALYANGLIDTSNEEKTNVSETETPENEYSGYDDYYN